MLSSSLLSRLYHDLDELHSTPYPGVAIFTDDANVRKFCLVLTPPSGPWKNLSLHFDVTLPENWPISPPSVVSSVHGIKHPNLFGTYICCDLLSEDIARTGGYMGGYTPALTLRGLFLQFLTFFSSSKIEQEDGSYVDIGDSVVVRYAREGHPAGKRPGSRFAVRGQEALRHEYESSRKPSIVVSREMSEVGPLVRTAKSPHSDPKRLLRIEEKNPRWADTFNAIRRWKCSHCPYGSDAVPHCVAGLEGEREIDETFVLLTPPAICRLGLLNDDALFALTSRLPSESVISFSDAYLRLRDIAQSMHVLLQRELRCFFLRTPLSDSVLGIGVAFDFRSRTLSSDFDWLSRTAFVDYGIRQSIEKREFSLAEIDSEVQSAEVELSRNPRHRAAGPTLRQETVRVVYRLMTHIVVSLMKSCEDALSSASNSKSLLHTSEKSVVSYCHLFHLLICLCRTDPQILKDATNRLRRFIDRKDFRIKTHVPDLGELIILIMLVVVEPRGALLGGGSDPERAVGAEGCSPSRGYGEGSERLPACRNILRSKTSLRLIMFQITFLDLFYKAYANSISRLDDNYGFPVKELPEKMVEEVKEIYKINTWPAFFMRVGAQGASLEKEQLSDMLRDAVKTSAARGYHDPSSPRQLGPLISQRSKVELESLLPVNRVLAAGEAGGYSEAHEIPPNASGLLQFPRTDSTDSIATFPVSEAFLSNPEIFKAPLDVIKTADGHIRYYLPSNSVAQVWQSYEHHKKLIGEPSYTSLIEALKPAAAGKLERHHVDIAGDANTALSSPATEFVVFTVKPEGSPEKLVPLLEELGKGLDISVGAHPPCMWGPSIEDKTKFLLVVGWDTVEAHWEAVKEGCKIGVVQRKSVLSPPTGSLLRQIYTTERGDLRPDPWDAIHLYLRTPVRYQCLDSRSDRRFNSFARQFSLRIPGFKQSHNWPSLDVGTRVASEEEQPARAVDDDIRRRVKTRQCEGFEGRCNVEEFEKVRGWNNRRVYSEVQQVWSSLDEGRDSRSVCKEGTATSSKKRGVQWVFPRSIVWILDIVNGGLDEGVGTTLVSRSRTSCSSIGFDSRMAITSSRLGDVRGCRTSSEMCAPAVILRVRIVDEACKFASGPKATHQGSRVSMAQHEGGPEIRGAQRDIVPVFGDAPYVMGNNHFKNGGDNFDGEFAEMVHLSAAMLQHLLLQFDEFLTTLRVTRVEPREGHVRHRCRLVESANSKEQSGCSRIACQWAGASLMTFFTSWREFFSFPCFSYTAARESYTVYSRSPPTSSALLLHGQICAACEGGAYLVQFSQSIIELRRFYAELGLGEMFYPRHGRRAQPGRVIWH
ncbi:hypothetical protein FB451DRAFT_1182208 [Mycena latifolia]|nr:hypothetical protein FB451DRAFT_1182208 [Mycena latifolia]